MGLGTYGSGSIPTEVFDGRQLELQATFDIGGVEELDPQGPDWEAQKLAFGRQVAVQVADEAVPQLLAQLGISGGPVAEWSVNTKSKLEGDLQTTPIGSTALYIRQQIGGVFRLTGDMTAGDLVFAARDSIASQIATHAIFALERHFEGKQKSNTDFAISRRNGEIVSYERTLKPQATGGEAEAAA